MKQKTTKSFWLRLCAVIAVVLCCAGMAWGQDTYVKVNSLDDLVTGGEYILATTSSNTTYVASGFSSSALSTISSGFSLNDNIITVTSGSPLIFTLGGTSTGYTLQYTNSGTKYLAYGSSTNLNQSDKNTTDNAKWTYNYNPDLSSYVLLNVATTNRFIGLAVSGNKVFRAYSTQNYSTYPIACLYKKSTGSSSPATATTTTIDHSGITNTDVYTGTNAGSLAASVTAGGNAVAGAAVTWSGNNDNVATIDESTGAVTLVAAGTVTFTASYAGNNDYQASSATYELTVTDSTPFECVIFKAAEDKDKNNTATGKGSIVKDNVNFSCISGILGNGSEYRMYKNSTVTISTTDGSLITKIEFTGVSGYPASGFGNQTGWSTSGYNGIWTGEAKSVSFEASGAQVRATEIKVTVVANSNPSIIANDMYIAFDEESGAIEFTIQNPVTGGELTATKTGDWLTLGTVGETVPFSCEANEAFTARTASIVLTYTYGKSNID